MISCEFVIQAIVGTLIALGVTSLIGLFLSMLSRPIDKVIQTDAKQQAEAYMRLRWEERMFYIEETKDDIHDPVRRILRAIHDTQHSLVEREEIAFAVSQTRWPLGKIQRYQRAKRRLAGMCERGCSRKAIKGDTESETSTLCEDCLFRREENNEERFPIEFLPQPRTWHFMDEPSDATDDIDSP